MRSGICFKIIAVGTRGRRNNTGQELTTVDWCGREGTLPCLLYFCACLKCLHLKFLTVKQNKINVTLGVIPLKRSALNLELAMEMQGHHSRSLREDGRVCLFASSPLPALITHPEIHSPPD